MEPTGWRKEPRYTLALTTIGVGSATYLCTLIDAPAWVAVLVGFILGVGSTMSLHAWRDAKMLDEVAAAVAEDAKRRIAGNGGRT